MSTAVIYSSTEGVLSKAWRIGTKLGGFDFRVRAAGMEDVERYFNPLTLGSKLQLSRLQIFGHGNEGVAYVGDDFIDFGYLAEVLSVREVWLRACDTFGRRRGQKFAKWLANLFGCPVVGHTRVISAPDPRYQSGGYVLFPGQEPYWDVEDAGGSTRGAEHTCTIFDYTVPDEWYIDAKIALSQQARSATE